MDKMVDYLKEPSLHPELSPFPPINKLTHCILYGPSGIGKYTHMLRSIQPYSLHKLKFEKKIQIISTTTFSIKISDIHYEVDMDMLGCNSKTLWNDIYNQIVDIINNKYTEKYGIIVCKNFHLINNELLDIFYSYMQTKQITYIFLMESISFLPTNILSKCKIIPIQRPSEQTYKDCLQVPIPPIIHNIKHVLYKQPYVDPKKNICTKISNYIVTQSFKFSELREDIYSIFIFDLGVEACIWSIISSLDVSHSKMKSIVYTTITFLQYYNNNYRPIYHLENYIYSLIRIIHEF